VVEDLITPEQFRLLITGYEAFLPEVALLSSSVPHTDIKSLSTEVLLAEIATKIKGIL
jgi:hypothetical protein